MSQGATNCCSWLQSDACDTHLGCCLLLGVLKCLIAFSLASNTVYAFKVVRERGRRLYTATQAPLSGALPFPLPSPRAARHSPLALICSRDCRWASQRRQAP